MIENNVDLAEHLRRLSFSSFEDDVVSHLAKQMRMEIDRDILQRVKQLVFPHT